MSSTILNKLRKIKQNILYTADDVRRILSFSNNEIINQKEIRIVGIKRSGNHGIITWIRRHYQDHVLHLNKVLPKQNPYRFLSEHFTKEKLIKEAKGNFTQKECLIYSYENCLLSDVTDPLFELKHDLYLGKSQERYDLLILRDPFNMAASMYRKLQEGSDVYMKVYSSNQNIMTLWLDYAKEFLGETNYLKHNKIVVNYNEWCLNRDYRQQISKKLGLEFSDAGFNIVKGYGGGSSFDGKNMDGKAFQMDTMNRWKVFAGDSEYKKMFNQTILDYSEKIFGQISGTEILLK